MRVLVLEGAGLAIPDEAVDTIEGVASTDEPAPWLPALLRGESTPPDEHRRALRLRGGGRVEVPAQMHIADAVEMLELPDLLVSIGHGCGVIGLVELPEGLTLVCDPRLHADVGGAEAHGGQAS